MKRLSLFLLLALVFTISAVAENNTVLKVHVEKAIAIPGNVLVPGDYIFRLSDVASGQSVVAVTSADASRNYGFVHVYSAQRNVGGSSEVQLAFAGDSSVDRIDSWFFPGEQHGYRFIYSKADLAKLSEVSQKLNVKGTATGF